jgi:catechol 2,3-dioxygenase-like lactoylglutathione lyase family enzyme
VQWVAAFEDNPNLPAVSSPAALTGEDAGGSLPAETMLRGTPIMPTAQTAAPVALPFDVKGLHHFAWKCQDPVKTRWFYETVLGMPLEHTVRATHRPSTGGEPVHFLHMFFRMTDGSYIAFFDLGDDEAALPSPNTAPWVNHIALEVADEATLEQARARLEAHGHPVVGPLNHGFVKSIYFFDPNGIRMEFTTRTPDDHIPGDGHKSAADAAAEFDQWLAERHRAAEFAKSWDLHPVY